MSLLGVVLVFLSAFLHAGWNFISKKCHSSAAFFLFMSISNAILWSWALWAYSDLWTGLSWKFWLLWGASRLAECIYCVGLARAYRVMDISVVYPMARALPVLMLAVITPLLGMGHIPGWQGMIGLITVSIGCFFIPLARFADFNWRNFTNPAMRFIFQAAAGTAGYTIVDKLAMQTIQEGCPDYPWLKVSLFYIGFVETGLALSLAITVFTQKKEIAALKQLIAQRSFFPVLAGLCSSTAYLLILIAMNYFTQLGFLQAFRQLSLPMGVLAGIIYLKERCSAPQWLGVTAIVTGLVLIAFV